MCCTRYKKGNQPSEEVSHNDFFLHIYMGTRGSECMKDQKLTYSFHNPNTDKETEKMLLQVFSQSLFKQVCNKLVSESDDLKEVVESETHFFTDQD